MELQLTFPDRMFLGKNKVMALALGRTPEEEPKENLHKITQVSCDYSFEKCMIY